VIAAPVRDVKFCSPGSETERPTPSQRGFARWNSRAGERGRQYCRRRGRDAAGVTSARSPRAPRGPGARRRTRPLAGEPRRPTRTDRTGRARRGGPAAPGPSRASRHVQRSTSPERANSVASVPPRGEPLSPASTARPWSAERRSSAVGRCRRRRSPAPRRAARPGSRHAGRRQAGAAGSSARSAPARTARARAAAAGIDRDHGGGPDQSRQLHALNTDPAGPPDADRLPGRARRGRLRALHGTATALVRTAAWANDRSSGIGTSVEGSG